MPEAGQLPARWRSVLQEPTFHFLLLAALVFAVNQLKPGRTAVRLDRGELAARIFQAEATRGMPLSPAERQQLEDAFVNEQILVLEARELGLDRDRRIHDLLAQKMLHVLSADVIQPDERELRTFYDANTDAYTVGPSVSLDEMVLAVPDSVPPPNVLEKLRLGEDPESFARDMPVTHGVLRDVALDDLAGILGGAFASTVFDAEKGLWVGPHRSVRGQHWYRVTARSPTVFQPFDAVRERVRLDWIDQEETARLEQTVAELRSRYSVVWTGEEVAR